MCSDSVCRPDAVEDLAGGGGGGCAPLILGEKEEMTEGINPGWASKIEPAPLLSWIRRWAANVTCQVTNAGNYIHTALRWSLFLFASCFPDIL